jgi:hypothetical protein
VLHREVFKDRIRIQPIIFTGAREVGPRDEVGVTPEVFVIQRARKSRVNRGFYSPAAALLGSERLTVE